MYVMGADVPPQEENADLTDFTTETVNLLLQGVYGDFYHYNDRSDPDRGVPNDTVWQRHWHWMDAQLVSWYNTPSGEVGCQFREILAAELQGVIERSWNSEIPPIFAHIVLKKMLGFHRTREIMQHITSRM